MTSYCFSSKRIHLEGQWIAREVVEVDTCACMEYLIENEGMNKKTLNDPLIKDHKKLLWQMTAVDPPVDIFDATTSSSRDYKLHVVIAPHRCQSYVQNHAIVAKNKCEGG